MNQTVSPILLLQKQRALLQMEYDAEKEEFRRQTETLGVRRKVKRGDCWLPLRIGRSYYNSLNQLVVEVFRTADTDVEHNFEFGRQVMFFHIDANDEIRYFSFSATVSYAEAERMVVAIPDAGCVAQLQGANQVGVQLSFDETTYRLMMDALERVMRAKGNRLAHLRDIFYNPSKTEKFTFAPMRFPWLNPTQEHAVNEVLLAKDVAIVHGPPGTGKTTTLVEAIFETLRRENQVMVCAQSNMAVDWISERLVDRGVEVLRIGNPTKVNDKMLSFTYERRFESHPDYPSLWALRKAIREMQGKRKRGDHGYHDKLDRLKSRATELEVRINAALFGNARVIACTLAGTRQPCAERHEVCHPLYRRGGASPGSGVLDSHQKGKPCDSRRRPPATPTHRQEHRGAERRTRHHADGAHCEKQSASGHAAENAIPHERRDYAFFKRVVLSRAGAERARSEVPQHSRLRHPNGVDRHLR